MDPRDLCDNEDIFLSEDAFSPISDEESYLVFRRQTNIFNKKNWELCFAGDTVGHEHALNAAIRERPIERNYPVEFLTVNTTSNNVRHHKVSITVEELG